MSETPAKKAGFPIGLTIATLIAFAILCVLGGWQIKRLAWKEDLLRRIEVLKTAPAQDLETVLGRAKAGEDLTWTRVTATCSGLAPRWADVASLPDAFNEPAPLVYGVRDGDIVWRANARCMGVGGGYEVILIDLGVVTALTGQPTPAPFPTPAVKKVTGILMNPHQLGGERAEYLSRMAPVRAAPYILMAESTTPAIPGVVPAPLPAEISNRHLEYALTWFGLAVTLLFIYAAMLWRRMRP
jgi:surfeit locus 1 family protein